MKERWRLINDPPLPGGWNMGIDAALLELAEKGSAEPTLRLYGWSRPTLSIGYKQAADKDLDLEFIFQNGIDTVRRPTGGRAILHMDEVTYAVILPSSSSYYGSLRDVYNFVSQALKEALSDLGMKADSHDIRKGPVSTPCCFSSMTRHEIMISGKKIVGSAQRRFRSAALQHGSIVLSQNAEMYLSCLKWSDDEKRMQAGGMIGGINDVSCEKIDAESLRRSVVKAFERLYDIHFIFGEISGHERELAGQEKDEFQILWGKNEKDGDSSGDGDVARVSGGVPFHGQGFQRG